MPWSLELQMVTALMGPPIRVQLRSLTEAFQRLGRFLRQRTEQAEALWQRTRAFPVVRFYNEAVTVWIESSQHQILQRLVPEPGFRELGSQFVPGLRRTVESVEEARLLPGLLADVN